MAACEDLSTYSDKSTDDNLMIPIQSLYYSHPVLHRPCRLCYFFRHFYSHARERDRLLQFVPLLHIVRVRMIGYRQDKDRDRRRARSNGTHLTCRPPKASIIGFITRPEKYGRHLLLQDLLTTGKQYYMLRSFIWNIIYYDLQKIVDTKNSERIPITCECYRRTKEDVFVSFVFLR